MFFGFCSESTDVQFEKFVISEGISSTYEGGEVLDLRSPREMVLRNVSDALGISFRLRTCRS